MRSRLWFLLSLLVAGTTSLYIHKILGPWEHFITVDSGKVKAQLGDLYSPWIGSRELLLHGRNPYSAAVSHEIQMGFYGHVIEQSFNQPEAGIIDEQRFAYPVYVAFLLGPTIRLDFEQAQFWSLPLLTALTAAGVLLWMDVLHWRLSTTATAGLILFVLSSPQVVQGLRLRQLGLLVGFLLPLATWCITRTHLASAGIILALCTIKPQMAALPVAWFLIWTFGEWRTRWRLCVSFLGGLIILVGIGQLVLPGWLSFFIAGLQAYHSYAPMSSLLRLALGKEPAQMASVILAFGLLALAWHERRCSAHTRRFNFALAVFLLSENIAFALIPPFNQVLLLLPVMIVLKDWKVLPRFFRIAFALCVSWPWISSCILLLVPLRINSTDSLPLLPSFPVVLVPLLLLPFMAMYRRGAC
jgi:hypothetical protein